MGTQTTIELIDTESIEMPSELLGRLMKEHNLNEVDVSAGARISKALVSLILKENRRITEVTALKLGRFFGVSHMLFINSQLTQDIRVATLTHKAELKSIRPISK